MSAGTLSRTLREERVRSDVEVLSRAGLDLETFLVEAVESVSRVVPWAGACVGTHDPATRILTGARKYGDLQGKNSADGLFGQIEYDSSERTSYHDLVDQRVDAVGIKRHYQGDIERSERMSRLMVPTFGYADEARTVFREGERFWGGMALFRGPDDRPFDDDEVGFLATLSGALARGVRAGILARFGAPATTTSSGPSALVVDASDQVVQMTPGAHAWLEALSSGAHSGDPAAVIVPLVVRARRHARGEDVGDPAARVRTADGVWLVLHASVLGGLDGRAGDVVVTIEEARPPEIVALVVAAFGLTARERDVTQLVLQGADTKRIAAALHLSAYTVQDHLKSIFEKAQVRSRRELVARVYLDQYRPRMGDQLTPSGWYA